MAVTIPQLFSSSFNDKEWQRLSVYDENWTDADGNKIAPMTDEKDQAEFDRQTIESLRRKKNEQHSNCG